VRECVIPSERSESRDLHLPFRSADPSTSLGMTEKGSESLDSDPFYSDPECLTLRI